MDIKTLSVITILSPLCAAVVAGVFGKKIGRVVAHRITILGVGIAFFFACWIAKLIYIDDIGRQSFLLYTWIDSGSFSFNVGFLVDRLSALMLLVVTSVSLLVHVYSIGYMVDDPGYQRFFSYISLFTFAMLALVLANNFMVLFFGWEGVGLVSYLLIGFWFKKDSATSGSLKAFIANRFGDFGMVLGIGAVLTHCGTLTYDGVFHKVSMLAANGATLSIIPGIHWPLVTVMCLLLFIGAMGKSAQVPLHVWLPESMEGPTPISALIHAATMVTAGVYMVARLSPMYELAPGALSVILVIGATGALFLGILGVVQNDIKRVIAYSTLSQLGYMIAGEGASAYPAGIFHLTTHAFFKALLFLAAGSVIIGMHHEQDMRKMGGLRKYMPITHITFLIGALSLCAIPPFAGFYSKDAIIEAVRLCHLPGAGYASICVLLGSFVTSLYTFRAYFLTFWGQERFSADLRAHLRESPWVVCLPLVCLAVPSMMLGGFLMVPMLFSQHPLLGNAITILPDHNVLIEMKTHFKGMLNIVEHAIFTLPFWLAVSGIATAYWCYQKQTQIPGLVVSKLGCVYGVLEDKYGFDRFNDWVFVRGINALGQWFYRVIDTLLIDHCCVNGSGRLVNRLSFLFKRLQTGLVYHYMFVMIAGLLSLLLWLVVF